MATVNLGSIKFNWKGTYVGATAYKIDDVVEYNGSSYISIQAGTGNLPTDTAYWELMSQKGTNGTDGTDFGTILTTQGDIVYRDASGIARLGAGTSGQALITNGTGANPSWGTVSAGVTNYVSFVNSSTFSGTMPADDIKVNTFSGTPLNANGTFTVPTAGNYFLSVSVMNNLNPGNNSLFIKINNTNIINTSIYMDAYDAMGSMTLIVPLSQNDTITFVSNNNIYYGYGSGAVIMQLN